MKIGFTGTRIGMTQFQLEKLAVYLLRYNPKEFHHGDCVGADTEAHHMVRKVLPNCMIVVHPSNMRYYRSFCEGDFILDPIPPLERNRVIVEKCDVLLAAPSEMEETVRSGTWATIRWARRVAKPVIIILPNRK